MCQLFSRHWRSRYGIGGCRTRDWLLERGSGDDPRILELALKLWILGEFLGIDLAEHAKQYDEGDEAIAAAALEPCRLFVDMCMMRVMFMRCGHGDIVAHLS